MATDVEWPWPTPIGIHQYVRAAEVNPLLLSAFADGRAALERQRGVEPGGPFFASDDDLLGRVKLPEWQRIQHPVYGVANGVTRLYGPHLGTLGGAFVDLGNAYLPALENSGLVSRVRVSSAAFKEALANGAVAQRSP